MRRVRVVNKAEHLQPYLQRVCQVLGCCSELVSATRYPMGHCNQTSCVKGQGKNILIASSNVLRKMSNTFTCIIWEASLLQIWAFWLVLYWSGFCHMDPYKPCICHIIKYMYLLTKITRAILGNIDPRTFLYGPRCAPSVLPWSRSNIPQCGSHARLVRGWY